MDVTISSFLQPTFIVNAAEKSGFALSAAEDRKYEQCAQKCSELGNLIQSLARESFGGVLETIRATLKHIATLAGNKVLEPVGSSVASGSLSQSVSAPAIRPLSVHYEADCKSRETVGTYETPATL